MSGGGLLRLWPGHPEPLADESFSSWFARLGASNGLAPADLYRVALSGAYLHRRDLDRFACAELIGNLAGHAGIEKRTLFDLTFARWRGTVFESDDGLCKLPWLPPAGTEGSKRSFGQQVCPLCLAEDSVPYLRAEWRLGFVTGCARHGVLLIDRCPTCAEPIQILKFGFGTSAMFPCSNCAEDLSRAAAEPAPDVGDFGIQAELLGIARDGWAPLGTYGLMHSLAWFRILSIVFRLLATGRYAYPLRGHVAARMGEEQPGPTNIPRVKEVERLNPRCRRTLIRMAHWSMQEWPDRFVDVCRAVGLTSHRLMHDRSPVPFAYWDAVKARLYRPWRSVSKEELQAAKAFLRIRGRKATYKALRELVGNKFGKKIESEAAVPGIRPYGTHRFWKLDGVSPEVRKAAKKAATRDGENVGAWVDKTLRAVLVKKFQLPLAIPEIVLTKRTHTKHSMNGGPNAGTENTEEPSQPDRDFRDG